MNLGQFFRALHTDSILHRPRIGSSNFDSTEIHYQLQSNHFSLFLFSRVPGLILYLHGDNCNFCDAFTSPKSQRIWIVWWTIFSIRGWQDGVRWWMSMSATKFPGLPKEVMKFVKWVTIGNPGNLTWQWTYLHIPGGRGDQHRLDRWDRRLEIHLVLDQNPWFF